MDKYKLKFTRLQNEIFRLLCIKSGLSMNQREIARLLKVSPTAVGKALNIFEEDGIVKITKKGNIKFNSIELNRDSSKVINMKRAENLKIVYESGIVEYLEDNFPGCTIILFGSFSLGEDVTNSDVDIAIIGTKGKDMNLIKYEKIFEKKIYIHFYMNLDIGENLKSNILNGITLSGMVNL